jgi:hypothetical protein
MYKRLTSLGLPRFRKHVRITVLRALCIQSVSGGIVNILGGGSMDCFE